METRTIEIRELRVDSAEGKPTKISGYAALYGSMSYDLGGFREIIAPGAFRDSVAGAEDIRALFAHDDQKLLGRTSSGTLRLREDDTGLGFELDCPDDVSYARDLLSLAKRKDIRGMSFGFNIDNPKEDQSWAKSGGQLIRTLKKVRVGEISFVSNPAYPGTNGQFAMREVRVDPAAVEFARDFDKPPAPTAPQKILHCIVASIGNP